MPAWIDQTKMEIFVVENTTLSRLNVYPSWFVKDALDLLQKAKTQNLAQQNQFRSLLSDVRVRVDQQDQKILEANELLRRLQAEFQVLSDRAGTSIKPTWLRPKINCAW